MKKRRSPYRGVNVHLLTHTVSAFLWLKHAPPAKLGHRSRGRQLYIGKFDTLEDAARAYDLVCLHVYGDEATTNWSKAAYTKDVPFIATLTVERLIELLRSGGYDEALRARDAELGEAELSDTEISIPGLLGGIDQACGGIAVE